jgi:hypothetical protein
MKSARMQLHPVASCEGFVSLIYRNQILSKKKWTKYTFGFRNPESSTELNFTPEEEN